MTERRRGLGRGLGALIPMRSAEDHSIRTDSDHRTDRAPAGTLSVDSLETSETNDGSTNGARHSAGGGVGSLRLAVDPSPQKTGDPDHRDDSPDVPSIAYFADIPVDSITTNPRQPRQVFDEDTLAELAHSIREVGVLQPVVVREIVVRPGSGNETGAENPAYELVMGERRWRAAQAAGLVTIPAIVRETKDDALLRDALLENLHRAQLNPLEEAAAYDQLLADFGCTQDELAQRIGRSRPQISNTLRLLRLPPEVQRRVAAGVLTAGHARALLGLDDLPAQERMAQRIVAEGLSVRTVEELVALGDLGPAERAPRRHHAPVAPALGDLGARLSERLETRVTVALGRRKGKITIEFASIADLERLVAVIDPDHDGDRTADSA